MTTTKGRVSVISFWLLLSCFLLLSWQPSAKAQIGDPAACSGPFPQMATGDSVDAALDTDSDCFFSGRLTDRYAFSLTEETLFRATMSTDGFDPLLILAQPSVSSSPLALRFGQQESSFTTEYLLPAGDYLLIAGSRMTDESAPPAGEYSLSLSTALPIDQLQDACTHMTYVTPGDSLSGEISTDDCRDTSDVDDETSPYQDAYQFIQQEGQLIYPYLESDVPVQLKHWYEGEFQQSYDIEAGEDIRLSLNRSGLHLFLVNGQTVADLGNYQFDLLLSQPELETVPVSFAYQFSNYRDVVDGEVETGPSDHVLRAVADVVFADDNDIFEVISIQSASLGDNDFTVGDNPGIVSLRADTPALLSLSGDLLDVLICPDGFTGNQDCPFGSEGGFLLSDFWPLTGDFAGQSGAAAGHPALGSNYRDINIPMNKNAWSAQVINHSAQRNALLALYNTTGGSNWTNQEGWLSEVGTECDWYGVSCNEHGNIAFLDLNNNNLSGTIPSALSHLVTASPIDLSNNNLTGEVPLDVLAMDVVNLWGNPELTGIEFGGEGACDSQTLLALGASVNGELTPFEDCYFDDDRIMADFYRLDLSGETGVTLITVEANADNYHPHMGVLDASGHEGEDIVDTQVQSNDLAFEVALPPGEYVLYIHGGTYQPQNVAATGSYTLSTTLANEAQLGCMVPTWVMKDMSLDSTISSDDCLDTYNDPDRYYDSYAIWLTEGESVLVDVTSDIPSQLLHFIAYDFSSATSPTPAGQEHALAFTATESGWHQFAVYNTANNPLEQGSYRITFGQLPDFGDDSACTIRPTITPGDEITATLSQTGDCYSSQGRMLDFYELNLENDALLRVNTEADDFDLSLLLYMAENPQLPISVRGAYQQTTLAVEYYLAAGQYRLLATSRLANPASPVEGDYSFAVSSAISVNDIQNGCFPPTTLLPGASTVAELSTQDCRYTSGDVEESTPYVDSYEVHASEGQLIYPAFDTGFPANFKHWYNGQVIDDFTLDANEDLRLSINRSGMHTFEIISLSAADLGSYEFDLLLEQPELETVPVAFSFTFDSYRDVVDGQNQIGAAEHVLTGIVDAVFADDDIFEVISIQEARLDGHALTVGNTPGIVATRDNTPALLSLSGDLMDVLICPNGFTQQLDCPFGTEGGFLLSDFSLGNGDSLALAGHPAFGASYRARSFPINRENWSASIIGFGAPEGSDNTISINEDQVYSFAEEDFGFSDADDNAFIGVRITSLPTAGDLTLDGTVVVAGQEIAVEDIAQLSFTPAANANGDGYSSFSFQVKDNGLDDNDGRANSTDLDPSPNMIVFDVSPVNDAPTGSSLVVDLAPNTSFTFSQAAFGFSDALDAPSPDVFAAVVIDGVPAEDEGELLLNEVAVTAGDVIAAADSSNLIYVPPQGVTENDFTRVNFRVRDDGGQDNGGIDTDETARTVTFNVGVVPPVVVDPDPDPTPDDVADELDDLNNELDDIESIPLQEGEPVSDEVVNQVSNALERSNALAQQVTQSLPEGEAGVNVALNALNTMTRTLSASARVSANGGAVSNSSATNSINSVATVLNSLATRSENITAEQRTAVQTMVTNTVTNSNDLIRNGASNDELVSMVAATSAVINAASAAGGELNSDLVTQAEALVTKAVKTGLTAFSADIDVEDPAQVESLLRDNPEALEFAIEASVAVKSRIQPDNDAVEEALSDRGIEGSASERFTQVLSAVSNPEGVSVEGSSGSEILLSALVNFLTGGSEALTLEDGRQVMALTAGDIDLTVDALTGTALITAPGETYSAAVVNTRIVSASVPEGLSFMRDGRALIVSDGVAIELAPIALDLIGFTDTVEKAGFALTLRDGGVLDISLSEQERFVGVFAFDNLSGTVSVADSGSHNRCDATTLIAPVNEVNAPAYAFGVQCGNGAIQRVVPFVQDPVFYRSIVDYGLVARTDRNTGVISISNTGKFKPGFFVSAPTADDLAFLEANKDARGVAFRFLDLNSDGQQDALFYTSAGVQPMYGVMP